MVRRRRRSRPASCRKRERVCRSEAWEGEPPAAAMFSPPPPAAVAAAGAAAPSMLLSGCNRLNAVEKANSEEPTNSAKAVFSSFASPT